MAEQANAYKKVDVETASQEKLVILLFNGAIQRAKEAKALIQEAQMDVQKIHDNLVRTQDIVTELRAALDMSTGEVAQNLNSLYEYCTHLLVQANIKKETKFIDESVDLMIQMRDMWKEAFDLVGRENAEAAAPKLNQHGSTLINLEG